MSAKPNYKGKRSFPYKYLETLEEIQRDTGKSLLEIFISFVTIVAGVYGSLPAIESKEHERWKKEHMALFEKALNELCEEMQCNPYKDILGEVYISLKYKGKGEFYTPDNICKMMGAMASSNPKPEPVRVAEPCCGAGQMILGLAKKYFEAKVPLEFLIVEAQDIDATACDLCFINTTLWGVPTIVRHGNSLTNEVWAVYPNIHYYRAVEFWKSWKILEAMKGIERKSKSKLKELRERRRPKLPQKQGQVSIMDYL